MYSLLQEKTKALLGDVDARSLQSFKHVEVAASALLIEPDKNPKWAHLQAFCKEQEKLFLACVAEGADTSVCAKALTQAVLNDELAWYDDVEIHTTYQSQLAKYLYS